MALKCDAESRLHHADFPQDLVHAPEHLRLSPRPGRIADPLRRTAAACDRARGVLQADRLEVHDRARFAVQHRPDVLSWPMAAVLPRVCANAQAAWTFGPIDPSANGSSASACGIGASPPAGSAVPNPDRRRRHRWRSPARRRGCRGEAARWRGPCRSRPRRRRAPAASPCRRYMVGMPPPPAQMTTHASLEQPLDRAQSRRCACGGGDGTTRRHRRRRA